MNQPYQSLSQDQKITVFQRCQELLVKNHPKSEFILRKNFLSSNQKTIQTLTKLYKEFNGNIYMERDCLIFYKMFDIKNGIEELQKRYDSASDDNGNLIFITFAIFNSKRMSIRRVIETQLQGQVEKISFSREGEFKIYNLKKLASKFL